MAGITVSMSSRNQEHAKVNKKEKNNAYIGLNDDVRGILPSEIFIY